MSEVVAVDDLGELDVDEPAGVKATPAVPAAACPTPRLTTPSTIRALTVEELPGIAPYGQDFYAEAKAPGRFLPAFFVSLWTTLITSGQGVILGVYEGAECVGALAAMVAPDIYDGRPIASEFFWYVRPEYRRGTVPVRLIRAYEAWAVSQGVASADVRMAALASMNDEAVGRLYDKLGYRRLETTWTKES
jgi:GNAT superfamily N-acetyltransferase